MALRSASLLFEGTSKDDRRASRGDSGTQTGKIGATVSSDESDAFQPLEIFVARVKLCIMMLGGGVDQRIGHMKAVLKAVVGGFERQRLVNIDHLRLAQRGDRFKSSLLILDFFHFSLDFIERDDRGDYFPLRRAVYDAVEL
jgi:hypothetical protein